MNENTLIQEFLKLVINSKSIPLLALVVAVYYIIKAFRNPRNANFVIRMYESKMDNIKQSIINENDLFRLEESDRFEINNTEFGNDVKTFFARILLKNKHDAILAEAKKFLNTYDLKRMNKINFVNQISLMTKRIIAKYESETQQDYKSVFIKYFGPEKGNNWANEKASEFYDLVYQKGFKLIHTDNIFFINSFIKSLYYEKRTCILSIYTLYMLYRMALILAIEDMKRTYANMNGHFLPFYELFHGKVLMFDKATKP